MKNYCRDTWIEVDLDAITANLQAFRRHIPAHSRIMAVVKAYGYGHGAVEVSRHALRHGADSLAVATLDEAICLRRAGIKAPILVLGYTPLDCVEKAAAFEVDITVSQIDWIKAADKILQQTDSLKPLAVHVSLDTGMGRMGVRTEEDLFQLVNALTSSPNLTWRGIYTHFASADEEDTTPAIQQHKRFLHYLQGLKQQGFSLPLVHCNNSAASMVFPDWSYDMIRLGISLYGLYPSSYLKQRNIIRLTPALSLKTRISRVKTMLSEPLTISYGATYLASMGETIATLPIGYADGFSRALSNRGYVLHRGSRVRVVGRVCMDQIMVSLPSDDARVGDEIVIYGRQGNEEITVDEVADQLGTINYEVVSILNHRIPRLYFANGELVAIDHMLGENK